MSVEGAKFEVAAVRNLVVLFGDADFRNVMKMLGVLKKDVKAAIFEASTKINAWAGREGAKGIAAATGVPYRGMRKRVRAKVRYQSVGGAFPEARIWFGLNDVPWKFLSPRQTRRGVKSTVGSRDSAFIGTGRHVFVRRGKERLPIDKVEHPIVKVGESYLQATFAPEVGEKFLEFFFEAMDRIGGKASGTSESVIGGAIERTTRFAGYGKPL